MDISIRESGIEQYLKDINSIPLLTFADEKELAKKMHHGKTIHTRKAAREKFIKSNLRLVISISKSFQNKGLPIQDLIEEGNIGLLKAVEKFNPKMNCRFSTYATWWIRQAVRRSLINTSKTVRIPSYMVEIISKWRITLQELIQKFGRKPTTNEILKNMGLGQEGGAILKRAISTSDNLSKPVSLDVMYPTGDVGDEYPTAEQDIIFTSLEEDRIENLLKVITEREARVLRYRYGLYDGQPMTLGQIGRKLKVTRERIRQIEKIALKKLRKKLKNVGIDSI
ncbi:MAG: hypothetical protein A2W05_01565 [Candidatus Schekmanbacteria bacterium RBG_16_38_10]|uniref:RNA polymerase sigma factor n=1 Tax=Candidatus Schekmanbacteria bacterium RBG_16_38_10 TaxID=1817879 RepID=A0A1F7RZ84_9BACT|nr:MAG: hypothetical protein A2W05_01565 [Candidatus Schekmanbacteria bacterium RBG_16_38_10]